jgi:hypothetical protein
VASLDKVILKMRHRIRDFLPRAVRPAARRAFQRVQASTVLTGATRRRLIRESPPKSPSRRLLEQVDLTISPSDTMFVASRGSAQYIGVGVDTVRCIDAVLAESGTHPTRVLHPRLDRLGAVPAVAADREGRDAAGAGLFVDPRCRDAEKFCDFTCRQQRPVHLS